VLRQTRDHLALPTLRRCRSCGTRIERGRTSCPACRDAVPLRRETLVRLAQPKDSSP